MGNHSVWGRTAGGEGDQPASTGGAAKSGAVVAGGSPVGGMLGLPRQFERACTLGCAVI